MNSSLCCALLAASAARTRHGGRGGLGHGAERLPQDRRRPSALPATTTAALLLLAALCASHLPSVQTDRNWAEGFVAEASNAQQPAVQHMASAAPAEQASLQRSTRRAGQPAAQHPPGGACNRTDARFLV